MSVSELVFTDFSHFSYSILVTLLPSILHLLLAYIPLGFNYFCFRVHSYFFLNLSRNLTKIDCLNLASVPFFKPTKRLLFNLLRSLMVLVINKFGVICKLVKKTVVAVPPRSKLETWLAYSSAKSHFKKINLAWFCTQLRVRSAQS